MMASAAAVGPNVEVVREYGDRVFKAHQPELAGKHEEWAADDPTAILHDVGVYSPPWLS
jgi:hypothetical protein